jgi:NADH-quinone oxidoreductase subunit C
LSSAEGTTTEATPEEAPAEETDELREGLLATMADALGDGVVGSHLRPGDDLWVRVTREAWREAAEVARTRLHCSYFCFLSGLDWMPSPYGRSEDSALEPNEAKEPAAMATGFAGGDTRFQLMTRLYAPSRGHGLTIKADLPDDDLRVDTLVPVYAGADWHEREAWEMFGVTFVGHPHLIHIYLPGEFEGHPLRKDFPLLAREVKPWPGIVDVEPMPEEEEEEEEAEGVDAEAPAAEQLVPEAPPADAPTTGDADRKPAVEAPAPTHGESASAEQLEEGEVAEKVSEIDAAEPDADEPDGDGDGGP